MYKSIIASLAVISAVSAQNDGDLSSANFLPSNSSAVEVQAPSSRDEELTQTSQDSNNGNDKDTSEEATSDDNGKLASTQQREQQEVSTTNGEIPSDDATTITTNEVNTGDHQKAESTIQPERQADNQGRSLVVYTPLSLNHLRRDPQYYADALSKIDPLNITINTTSQNSTDSDNSAIESSATNTTQTSTTQSSETRGETVPTWKKWYRKGVYIFGQLRNKVVDFRECRAQIQKSRENSKWHCSFKTLFGWGGSTIVTWPDCEKVDWSCRGQCHARFSHDIVWAKKRRTKAELLTCTFRSKPVNS